MEGGGGDTSAFMAAFMAVAGLPGVGPVTAERMVAAYPNTIMAVLDSPNAAQLLMHCKGIGSKTATKIKSAWDSSKGKPSFLGQLHCCMAVEGPPM